MTSDDFRDRGQEAHGLPVSLGDWHSEDIVGEMDASLTSHTERTGLLTLINYYSRRGVLEMALLLSVISSMICVALWSSGIVTLDTNSHTTNASLETTKQARQVVPQAASTSTVQSSQHAANSPVSLPSAQATPEGPITSPSIVQSSSSTAPTPAPPTSYEAEAPQNTLANGARVVGGCASCSGNERVGYIGLNAGEAGTLQFNNVDKNVGGHYTLTISYLIAGSDTLTMDISVNGGSATALNVAATANGDTIGTASTLINLNAGSNTIAFSNPSDPAPDIDRIVV